MTLVVTTSVHGSPGTTTLAFALAGLRQGIVVEADPAGGVLAARCGLRREPGLASLVADRRSVDPTIVEAHAQRTTTDLAVVPCSESAEHTAGLLTSMANHLADLLIASERDVVADVGRLANPALVRPLLDGADVVLVVVRPRVDELAVLASRLPSIASDRLIVVTVGEHPYRAADVATELDVIAVPVAADARGADALWTGRRAGRLGASAYARSVVALDEVLPRALEVLA